MRRLTRSGWVKRLMRPFLFQIVQELLGGSGEFFRQTRLQTGLQQHARLFKIFGLISIVAPRQEKVSILHQRDVPLQRSGVISRSFHLMARFTQTTAIMSSQNPTVRVVPEKFGENRSRRGKIAFV